MSSGELHNNMLCQGSLPATALGALDPDVNRAGGYRTFFGQIAAVGFDAAMMGSGLEVDCYVQSGGGPNMGP